MEIKSRMETVQTPIIPVIGQLIESNPGTISLGQGVVSYQPPQEAIANLAKFLATPNNHKYKAVEGIPELINAISSKLKADNGIEINQKNKIVVTAGSNMAFMNAILAITEPEDEIILLSPYYFNHEMAVIMANCRPVIVATDENYQPIPEAIARAITHKTKAVVTISPNNPTGVVYSQNTLSQINQICREKGIYHINDETYEYFTYNGIKHISPASFADSEDYTISLYSLSKAYGFASWRIGYMVIPENLLLSVRKIQDTIVICPPVISQYAAIGALQAGRAYCREHLLEIAEVRKIVLEALQQIDDVCTIAPAKGAFYFFLKVHTSMNDFELVKRLIEEYKVAAIGGGTFGMNLGCYLRIAYGALTLETALKGIERLVKGLKEIVGEGV